MESSQGQGQWAQAFRVLLFNATGERRRAECMLEPLSHLDFDLALFCTNVSRLPRGAVSDNTNRTVTFEAIRWVRVDQILMEYVEF